MPHLLLVPACELNRINRNRDRCLDLTVVMSSIGDETRKEKARETDKATLIESPQLPADDSSVVPLATGRYP